MDYPSARDVWKDATDAGITFECRRTGCPELKVNYDNMRFKTDGKDYVTACEVDGKKRQFEQRIKKYENELSAIVERITIISDFQTLLNSISVDETNQQLLRDCQQAIDRTLRRT